MANALGIDLAEVYRTRDARADAADQRQNNALVRGLNSLKLDAGRAALEREQQANSVMQGYGTANMAGKRDRIKRLYDLDPEKAAKLNEFLNNATEEQRKTMEEASHYVGRVGYGLLDLPDAEFQKMYPQVLIEANRRWKGLADDAPPMNAPIEQQRAWVSMQVDDALGVEGAMKRRSKGKPTKAADGYLYYPDGTRAFPNVQKPKEPRDRRELKTGDSIKTQEFNPDTGQWETTATAPRFKEESSNSGREDFMIDNDRKILLQKLEGMTPAELLKRTQKSTDTGFENPNYDPVLEKQIRNALKKKRGDDPEFDRFQQLFAGAKGPEAEQPTVQAPQGAIDYLKANPGLAADFDAKYGKGAAQSVLQGE